MIEDNALYVSEHTTTANISYCEDHSMPLAPHVVGHHTFTASRMPDQKDMMISKLQAQFLLWFARTIGTKRVLEIGCFTGFSSLVWAEAIKGIEGAKIITTEINPDTAEIARKVFKDAGLDNIIELREGPADQTLASLSSEEPFDFIFLDANKDGYVGYVDQILSLGLLRPGGVLVADNVLKRGLVADPSEHNPNSRDKSLLDNAEYLRKFNDVVRDDSRVEAIILPVFDGLTMARRI